MFLVRDIMFCKPGQARPMVQKFLALSKLGQQMGFGAKKQNSKRQRQAKRHRSPIVRPGRGN